MVSLWPRPVEHPPWHPLTKKHQGLKITPASSMAERPQSRSMICETRNLIERPSSAALSMTGRSILLFFSEDFYPVRSPLMRHVHIALSLGIRRQHPIMMGEHSSTRPSMTAPNITVIRRIPHEAQDPLAYFACPLQ